MTDQPSTPRLGSQPDDGAALIEVVTTGDIVIDSALRDLAGVEPGDLDGHIETAQALHETLQGRLSDLGE